MWNGNLDKFPAARGISKLLVKAERGLTGMHTKLLVTQVPGDIFCKYHKRTPDTLALHTIGHGHLTKTYRVVIDSGKKAATKQSVVFKSAHQYVFFLFIQ